MISKKDLLKQMNISYGQLYRWKREGLIPDEWFIKQSVSSGQETYFKSELIIPRISKILELKDKYQLEELRTFFKPNPLERSFTVREIVLMESIDPVILRMYCQNEKVISIFEIAIIYIFSNNKDLLNYDDYCEYDFSSLSEVNTYFYILENQKFFILIGNNNCIIDKKLRIVKKINLEDIITKIAKELKE